MTTTAPTFKLHGFAFSNYYNKVKIALLEKGLAFEEVVVRTPIKDEATLALSPAGKVPFLTTPIGALSESQAIVEYLDAIAPSPRLIPSDAFAAAKVRELCTYIDLHLELVARELYGQAFFGGSANEATVERVKKQLGKNIPAFMRLAKFSPYVAGDQLTAADLNAYAALPAVAMATKAIYGEDLLAAGGVDWKAHAKLMATRPSVQRVDADRKADQAAMAAKSAKT